MDGKISQALCEVLRGVTTPIAALLCIMALLTVFSCMVLSAEVGTTLTGISIILTWVAYIGVLAFVCIASCRWPTGLTFDKEAHIKTIELDKNEAYSGVEIDEPWGFDGEVLSPEPCSAQATEKSEHSN